MIEIDVWLDTHRCQGRGPNRFIIDYSLVRDAFHDYPPKLVLKAWAEMIKLGWIVNDPLDNVWIVRMAKGGLG